MDNARQAAFDVLLRVRRDGAYSNLTVDSVLKENKGLDERDGAFVRALVYGTLDRLIVLDYNLGLYLNQPARKLRPELQTILRMGAYQILFMDKVPVSAAVNESVRLAKENKSAFAASLVNAILRRVTDNGLRLPDESENRLTYLSVKYSCPEWIISLWLDAYGEKNALALAEEALQPAPLVIRVNTLKTTADELIWTLAQEGVVAEKAPLVSDSLIINAQGALERTDCYKNGLFYVQDIASQLCCRALGAKEGETVFDLCSAPGGKAFTLAQMMNNSGRLAAFDIYQSRVELIKQGAERLGINIIESNLADASIYNNLYGTADKVLCDVPCSGLGIIRRKPEIRYKTREDIDFLPDLQYRILCNGMRYVKPGGVLMYSTCTLNPAENSAVCDRFLSEHPDFESVRLLPELERFGGSERYLTLMPHIHSTDGFFMAAFVNNGEGV